VKRLGRGLMKVFRRRCLSCLAALMGKVGAKVGGQGRRGKVAVGCLGSPAGDAEFQGASSDGTLGKVAKGSKEGTRAEGRRPVDAVVQEGATGCNLYESECPGRCER
jgi:hypothetical protein